VFSVRFDVSTLVGAVGGDRRGPDVVVDGANIDSRELVSGQLFVPIVSDRDGHHFIAGALERGAPAYLTEHEPDRTAGGLATAVVVEDTARALTTAGGLARDELDRGSVREVVGITGSVGKTSVKDLTHAACSSWFRTEANLRSFNNELGVPLTLLNAPGDTEIMIVEMGARGAGHISELCEVGRPTIGVVTMVGAAHTEAFGDVEAVARAKSELVQALPASGTAVLNAEVPLVVAMAARTEAEVVTFGAGGDVRAERVELGPDLTVRYRLVSDWGKAEVALPVRGVHNVVNSLAAATVALVSSVPVDSVVEGLAAAVLSPWRMEVTTAASGAVVINDAYNANPMSVRAALESLAAVDATRRVAILGRMAELGTEEEPAHRAMSELAHELGVTVIAVDCAAYTVADVHVTDHDGALAELGPLGQGDAVLVKGSRVAGLEQLAARLA